MPASTCPPTKKPRLKFMYEAAMPPSGPSTRMATALSSRWNFHEPGAGSQPKRGAPPSKEAAAGDGGVEGDGSGEVDRAMGGVGYRKGAPHVWCSLARSAF